MRKETYVGSQFYTKLGKKPVTIYLEKDDHKALKELAKKMDNSIQRTSRKIILDYLERIRKKQNGRG